MNYETSLDKLAKIRVLSYHHTICYSIYCFMVISLIFSTHISDLYSHVHVL